MVRFWYNSHSILFNKIFRDSLLAKYNFDSNLKNVQNNIKSKVIHCTLYILSYQNTYIKQQYPDFTRLLNITNQTTSLIYLGFLFILTPIELSKTTWPKRLFWCNLNFVTILLYKEFNNE